MRKFNPDKTLEMSQNRMRNIHLQKKIFLQENQNLQQEILIYK